MSAPRYDNPQALRQALADRLRPLSETSGMELSALLRQFAYDRLLCRVFSTDPERWVLMTGAAEELPPLIPIELPGVRHVTYRVYPIADHIADKVCAMFERHRGPTGAPSKAPATGIWSISSPSPTPRRSVHRSCVERFTRRRSVAI
jgi:hypothetical protein